MIPNPENPITVRLLEKSASREAARLEWHQIYLIDNGSGLLEIDSTQSPIADLQVVSIPRGAIHKADWEECAGYEIRFLEEFFTEVQRQLLEAYILYAVLNRKLVLQVPQSKFELIERYVQLIELEIKNTEDANLLFILQNLLLALFNRLEGLILEKDSPFITNRSVFQQFVQLLNEHYLKHKSVSFYTDALNITGKHLNKILKETVGQSAQEVISEKNLMEAKRLLCFTPRTIKEISHALGFDNPYYFSRFFKSKTHLTPEEFRNSYAM